MTYGFGSKSRGFVAEIRFYENGGTNSMQLKTCGFSTKRRLIWSLADDDRRNWIGGAAKESASVVGGMNCLNHLLARWDICSD